jgi:hypothetical protein
MNTRVPFTNFGGCPPAFLGSGQGPPWKNGFLGFFFWGSPACEDRRSFLFCRGRCSSLPSQTSSKKIHGLQILFQHFVEPGLVLSSFQTASFKPFHLRLFSPLFTDCCNSPELCRLTQYPNTWPNLAAATDRLGLLSPPFCHAPCVRKWS